MASLPKTYKAAAFQMANEPLTIVDVELKLPAVGEVLVKVLAVGKDHSPRTNSWLIIFQVSATLIPWFR